MGDFLGLLTSNSLTRVVFFPALACLPLLFFRKEAERQIKMFALSASLIQLAITVVLVAGGLSGGGFEILRDVGADGKPLSWIARYGVTFDLRMDGISMPLVLLTTFLTPDGILIGSWRGIERKLRQGVHAIFDVPAHSRRACSERLLLPGPLPLLRLLGSDADPHVLPDRDLGTRAARSTPR